MEKWATDGRGRREGGRVGGREGEATMEERKNCGEEKRKRGKKGKFKMRGFLQSDVGRRSGGNRGREQGGNDTRLLTGTFFSSPYFFSGYIIVK